MSGAQSPFPFASLTQSPQAFHMPGPINAAPQYGPGMPAPMPLMPAPQTMQNQQVFSPQQMNPQANLAMFGQAAQAPVQQGAGNNQSMAALMPYLQALQGSPSGAPTSPLGNLPQVQPGAPIPTMAAPAPQTSVPGAGLPLPPQPATTGNGGGIPPPGADPSNYNLNAIMTYQPGPGYLQTYGQWFGTPGQGNVGQGGNGGSEGAASGGGDTSEGGSGSSGLG